MPLTPEQDRCRKQQQRQREGIVPRAVLTPEVARDRHRQRQRASWSRSRSGSVALSSPSPSPSSPDSMSSVVSYNPRDRPEFNRVRMAARRMQRAEDEGRPILRARSSSSTEVDVSAPAASSPSVDIGAIIDDVFGAVDPEAFAREMDELVREVDEFRCVPPLPFPPVLF